MSFVLQGRRRKNSQEPQSNSPFDGAIRPVLEWLEERWLLSSGSVTLNHGELDVVGGRASNQINITMDANDSSKLDVTVNGVNSTFNAADVKLIVAVGGSGNDQIITDSSVTIDEKIYGGNGTNVLVGGNGSDSIFGGNGIDKIVGGTKHNKIDGGGGGDLINTQGAPSVVARHRYQQLVDSAGATLANTDRHTSTKKNTYVGSSVNPIIHPSAGPGIDGAYTPAQISHAYGVDQLDTANPQFPTYTNTGAGQTIVIVGGYASPFIGKDVLAFDTAFGLPPVALTLTAPVGQTTLRSLNAEIETALDIEWAHAMAPSANIVMVQVDSVNGGFFASDLLLGVQMAGVIANQAGGGVVSMSFGSNAEDPTLASEFDAVFGSKSNRSVSWVAAAGDTGGVLSDPATSPYVTAVGGTTDQLDNVGNIVNQDAWTYGGGGTSGTEPLPSYQSGLTVNGRSIGKYRTVPDVSLIADARFGAVQIYINATSTLSSVEVGVSGTSVGTPIFAGMVALGNELRATEGLGTIGSQLNPMIYQAYKLNPYGGTITTTGSPTTTGNFVDVITGNNGKQQAYRGYDLATGVGSPQAQNLIPFFGGNQYSVSNLKLVGEIIAAIPSGGLTGSAITNVTGSGKAIIGPQKITLSLITPTTLPSGSIVTTGAITVTRTLDNKFFGQVTDTLTLTTTDSSTGTTTTTTYNFYLQISGTVSVGSNGQEGLSGTIITIDPNTGKPLHQGSQAVFQGTITA